MQYFLDLDYLNEILEKHYLGLNPRMLPTIYQQSLSNLEYHAATYLELN